MLRNLPPNTTIIYMQICTSTVDLSPESNPTTNKYNFCTFTFIQVNNLCKHVKNNGDTHDPYIASQ